MLHARSLVPLVETRHFGTTQPQEKAHQKVRWQENEKARKNGGTRVPPFSSEEQRAYYY